VLLADEPTSSLDVTVQAQVLELLGTLVAETEMAMVLITHNLAVAVGLADRIAVMYAGRLVELGPARDVYARRSTPTRRGCSRDPGHHDPRGSAAGDQGAPPNLLRLPTGCAFHPRCPLADDRCKAEVPPFEEVAPGRWSACFHADEVKR
jgi:oligopeptide/dipeptide ABC transporter ATP-binding protein